MNALVGAHDAAVQMIDTSIVRVHQHGAYSEQQTVDGSVTRRLTFGHVKDVLVLISIRPRLMAPRLRLLDASASF
jgi:hypothetical protein